MDRKDLLPGVTTDDYEPAVVCDSRAIIIRARRLALLRDISQLILIAAVDYLFIHWPSTRVPSLGRDASLIVVVAFNALVAAHIYLARKVPQWIARRIANTWCPAERRRFSTTVPARGRR